MNVAAETIELGDDDWGALAATLGGGQSRSQLRATVESVGALACLHLGESLQKVEPLGLSETGERSRLRFEPQTGAPLFVGRDPRVGDG